MDTVYLLQSLAAPAFDGVALAVTNLGHELTYIGLMVVVYLALDPSRGRRLGIYFLLALYLNGLLKDFFDTPRPYQIDPSVLRGEAAQASAPGAGFPSGHAQSAATFWGIAAFYLRRPLFTAAAVVIVILVGVSRIYLGVHLPIDVVVGIALGGLAVALVPLLDRLELPLPAPVGFLGGLTLPLILHLLLPATYSELLLGGLAGFLTAPYLYRYRLPVGWQRRVVAAALGLILVFAAYFGSSLLLPEEIKRHLLGGYLRYLAIAYVGLVLAPALVGAIFRSPPQQTNESSVRRA